MVTEEGIITSTLSSQAWVKTVRSKSCESCEARDSCHTGDSSKEMIVQVTNTINAGIGDRVVLGFQTSSLLKLTFMLYVFPIILLIVGAALGQSIAPQLNTDQTLTSIFVGFGFFGLAFGIIRLTSNRLEKQKEYKPFLIRIVQKKIS